MQVGLIVGACWMEKISTGHSAFCFAAIFATWSLYGWSVPQITSQNRKKEP